MSENDQSTDSTKKTIADTTEYDSERLPTELQHSDILAFRDVSGPSWEAYQIIFNKSWMPFDYTIPDGFEMQYARLERHNDPDRHALVRLLTPKKETVCIVVSEPYESYRERFLESDTE